MAKGERNYHIFYYILSDPAIRQQWKLPAASRCAYLHWGGSVAAVEGSDARAFAAARVALRSFGVCSQAAERGGAAVRAVRVNDERAARSERPPMSLVDAVRDHARSCEIIMTCEITNPVAARVGGRDGVAIRRGGGAGGQPAVRG